MLLTMWCPVLTGGHSLMVVVCGETGKAILSLSAIALLKGLPLHKIAVGWRCCLDLEEQNSLPGCTG